MHDHWCIRTSTPSKELMKMPLLPAAAVGLLLLLLTCVFIAVARCCTNLLVNGRRRLNFAIQETTQDATSALVFGSHPPLPIRDVNKPPRVMRATELIIHCTCILHYQHLNNYTNGYQAPNQDCCEPHGVMHAEVYPVQESPRGYMGTSVHV